MPVLMSVNDSRGLSAPSWGKSNVDVLITSWLFACEHERVLLCFNERQISIVCALNNRANQSAGSCLIER